MSLREYLRGLEEQSQITRISGSISKNIEISAVLNEIQPRPALFDHVRETPDFHVAGNLFCSKAAFADYFGLPVEKIIPFLSSAIEQAAPCKVVTQAPCQEIIDTNPNLDNYPILRYREGDGGAYITSGVVVARHPHFGQNLDFHRCMQVTQQEMSMRVVEGRHFDHFLKEQKTIDVAMCIGNPPNILAAAATSVAIGVNELEIANAMQPLALVRAKTVDVFIPAETEFVLEGAVFYDRRLAEGPFVDLTETEDVVRMEPVFVVKTITHRKNAIWQALLPGGLEHKLLMGMPREPTIFRKVNEVVRCIDVYINPGGCSWLHTIVKIDKQADDDGKKAIQAAFAGHNSCKHVFVVDKDIDIYNPLEVEWAMATRFQGDVDMVIKERERGSSLDPSAEAGSHLTTKIGFDLTKPLHSKGKNFEKAPYPKVDIDKFMQQA